MRLPDHTVRIRTARPGDASAVQGIYDYHVAHGTGTFDAEGPDEAEWAAKIGSVCARGWPFLIAARSEAVAGYGYAAQFRDRAAYARTCENSIYVAHEQRGKGIGRLLLDALIHAARESGFEQMIAIIGGGEPASVALHTSAGFVHAGRLRNVGWKFGRSLDTVYMQRDLANGGSCL
ncbi:GNAT family N-acetyltransferase [Erythrobacter rubeus]|uniref:GNAT family N-acetyltransferase n=1 Tax=Erythrobacter rubeus TaxID=2760803 RepID=UPI0038B36A01